MIDTQPGIHTAIGLFGNNLCHSPWGSYCLSCLYCQWGSCRDVGDSKPLEYTYVSCLLCIKAPQATRSLLVTLPGKWGLLDVYTVIWIEDQCDLSVWRQIMRIFLRFSQYCLKVTTYLTWGFDKSGN